MGEEAQGARRGQRRVLLPQRASGGVARIGELPGLACIARRLGLGEQARIEPGERLLLHVDFAADLEQVGRPSRQPAGNVADRQHVGRHVLADLAVAAGQRPHQPAALVAQRAGQAVDLRLGGQRQFGVVGEAQEAPHPREEIRHLFLGKGIVEAEHRQRVADLGEEGGRRRPDLAGRAVGADEIGELRLQLGIAPHQGIIIGIGNLRRVVAVVEPIVMRDRPREPFQLHGGFGFCDRAAHGAGVPAQHHERLARASI